MPQLHSPCRIRFNVSQTGSSRKMPVTTSARTYTTPRDTIGAFNSTSAGRLPKFGWFGGRCGNRTHTGGARGILSAFRLPVSASGHGLPLKSRRSAPQEPFRARSGLGGPKSLQGPDPVLLFVKHAGLSSPACVDRFTTRAHVGSRNSGLAWGHADAAAQQLTGQRRMAHMARDKAGAWQ